MVSVGKPDALLRLTIILLFLVLSASVANANLTLRLGVFIIDPIVTRDADGRFHGAVVEVAEHIASLEGWELEIVQCDFHECLSMLETEELDLASPMAYTEKRSEKYDYIEETLLMDWGQIYASKDQKINSILDLQGKSVVTLKQTVFNDSFMNMLESFDIKIEKIDVDDYIDVFRYVEDGRADAMVLNRLFGEKKIREFGNVEKTPIIFKPIDIRYATPKGTHKDIRDALDRRLRELKADPFSEYQQAIARMFGSGEDTARVRKLVRWAAGITGGLFLFLLTMSYVLRRQVNERTQELSREVKERIQAQQALSESRESFKALVEFTAAIHWELDFSTRQFTYVSPQAQDMLGYPLSDWEDLDFWASIIHEKDRGWAVEYCIGEAEKGHDHEFLYRAIASDGRIVWLRDIVKVISGDKGPEKLIGIMFDMTGQKLSEQRLEDSVHEKEVLLKEIHHRVKNNMAIISSLSNLQSKYLQDKEAIRILKEGRDRIRSMALVHEQLYQSNSLLDVSVAEYVRRLVENVVGSYAVNESSNIKIDCDDFRLNIDTLIPCGLIINELLTNALKYAYQRPGEGETRISLKKRGEEEVVLQVSDSGGGLPESVDLEEPRTLGLQLVKTLAAQLDGRLSIDGNGGMTVEIAFHKAAEQFG